MIGKRIIILKNKINLKGLIVIDKKILLLTHKSKRRKPQMSKAGWYIKNFKKKIIIDNNIIIIKKALQAENNKKKYIAINIPYYKTKDSSKPNIMHNSSRIIHLASNEFILGLDNAKIIIIIIINKNKGEHMSKV